MCDGPVKVFKAQAVDLDAVGCLNESLDVLNHEICFILVSSDSELSNQKRKVEQRTDQSKNLSYT